MGERSRAGHSAVSMVRTLGDEELDDEVDDVELEDAVDGLKETYIAAAAITIIKIRATAAMVLLTAVLSRCRSKLVNEPKIKKKIRYLNFDLHSAGNLVEQYLKTKIAFQHP